MGIGDWLKRKQEEYLKSQNSVIVPNPQDGFGIKLNAEEQRLENEKFKEIADRAIEEITKCGLFKPEKIPILTEKINKITVPGYGFSDPFSYDDCLSLDEKKTLGLNTRQKFSREYIESLSPSGLKHENPKDIFKNIWINKNRAVHSKYDRLRFEDLGLKMYVWETCNDERVCESCKKMEGKLCLIADPTVYSRNKGKDWIPRPKGAPLTHPGEEDGCRCTAISYYPELVMEV